MELRRRSRGVKFVLLATAAQLIAAAFGVSMLLAPAATDAAQTVPYKINFQGRLTDNSGNALSDGLYNIKFRFWTAVTSGTNVWEEDRVITGTDNRVQVTAGLFNIQFGDLTALSPSLFSNGTFPLYLEVELPTPATATCATNGCAVFTEGAMTPRQPLASAPSAISADTLDGLDSTAFGQLAASNTFTGANIFTPTSGVAITVKPVAATHSLDVKDSSGTLQAYFDASGILNVGQTIQATAGTVDLGTSSSTFRTGYFGTSVQTPALNASSSGGTITTNLGTLQRVATGTTTIDLKDAGTTTLAVTNSGGGVAGISATGGLTIGTGKVITVGAAAGAGVSCSSGQILDAIAVTGGVVTGGTCIAAGGGDKLASTWTSQQATTATNTQTTVQFTGTANSSPSFNNATHVLTLPSNASKLTIETKAGGGGGGSVGTTNSIKAAAGGGEGGDSQTFITSSLPSNYYFTVGGGGAGGAATGTNPGTTGSSSCFGTNAANACTSPLASAIGGSGGAGVTTAVPVLGGAGGASASGVGDIKRSGAPGGNSTATTTTGIESGNGGGAGGGVGFAGAAAASAGNVGTSGGGGSGAIQGTAAATGRAGGNGGDGYVVITVYTTVAGLGNPATIQTAYDNSTSPQLVLDGNGGLIVHDSSGGVGGNLFAVQDNTGATNYLAVTTAGVSTSGVLSANATNTINGLSVNAGALSGVTGYTQTSGTFSQTLSSASATSAHSIALTNTDAAAGVAIQGINLTPTNSVAPSSGSNTLNLINFAAGTGGTGSDVTNAVNFASTTGYTNFIQTPNFDLNSSGDLTTAGTAITGTSTANGAGTASTTLVLASATNFVVGNYVQMNSANCGGAGVNPCYAKITAIATNTLTITPALTWANGSTVNQYHLPEIGGIDTSQALANRYGRGYFIAGVATGNGTTYYQEDSITSSLSTFNLLVSNVTTLNIGTATTSLSLGSASTAVSIPGDLTVAGQSIVDGSGQINGAQLQSGTVANTALANSSITINGTGISGGGTVSLGGTISLATTYGSTTNTAVQGSTTLICPTGTGNLSNASGGNTITLGTGGTCSALNTTQSPTFTTSVTSPVFTGAGAVAVNSGAASALTLDSTNGTLIFGTNTTTLQKAGNALAIDLNSAGTSTLTVKNSNGANVTNINATGGLTIGSGQVFTIGAATGQAATVSCTANQAVTAAVFTGGILTTAPTCSTISGTGATTTLNNVGSTSIPAALVASANNTQNIGAAATVWQNVYTGNLDAGTTTTALTVGTAATTTAITIGRSGVAVSIPGGLTTSGGAINTGAGGITTTGALSAGGITGTSLGLGSGNITTSGTIASGTVNGQTIGNASSFVTSVTAPTINGSTALQVGGANINTGGATPTLSNVDYLDAATTLTATKTYSKSGGQAAIFSGTAASAGAIIQFGSVASLSAGSANGTYLGADPAAYSGDFVNLQINNVVKLKVDNTGAETLAAGLTIGSGTAITVGASAGQTSTVACSAGQAVTSATFTGGVLTTAPGCATISGTGATTTLNNLGTTSINADLLPNANNTRSVGSASLVWANIFTGNLDAGTTTTALTVGTAATTTAITIGRSAVAVSLPGGLTTSGGAINTGAGGITSTGTVAGNLFSGSGASLTNLNPTSLVTGTGAVAIQAASGSNLGLTAAGAGVINLTTTTGSINLVTGGSSAGVTVAPTVNTAAALQVENATGVPIFLVDTSTSLSGNLLTYGGFEIGNATPTGWSAIGAPTTFARNTAAPNHYGGLASLQLVTTATAANQGATTSTFNSAPAAGSYVVSFYAEQTAGTALASSTLQAVINGAATSCTAGVTLSTTGFQRVLCPVVAAATITSLGIQVPAGSAGVRTIYIDAVQLVSGASATPATGGAIQLRGAVDSPAVFQALSNSTTAFQIQNTAGTGNTFVVDTLNGRIGIGKLSPATTLDVNGIANATSYDVAGTAGLASVACTSGQVLQNSTITGGIITAGSCTAAAPATVTLNNLGSTAVNASIIPATNNTIDLGSTTIGWNNIYSDNFDADSTTPTLTVGTGNATSITIGKSGVAASLPGGLTTSGGSINTGTGAITSTGTITGNLFSGSGASLTSLNPTNLATGTGAVTLQSAAASNLNITAGTTGGVTIDSSSTGGINLGNNANAKIITIGNTTGATAVNVSAGSGGLNLSDDATTKTIDIGGVTNDGTDTIRIATNGTANADSIAIGNSLAGTALTLDAGNTGKLQIGNTTAAHTIQIGTGGAAAGNAQTISIGSGTTSTASAVTFQGGNLTTTNGNAGIIIGGGYSASDTNLVGLTLDSSSTFAETANTCTATVNGGTLYYNSTSNAIRSCINGGWEDVVTTAGLGILTFGVVPDSGSGGGDIGSITGAGTNGPCKVSWATATTVKIVQGCAVYSGGRKVIIADNTTPSGSLTFTNSNTVHVCLTGTNNQPAFSTSGTEVANLPTFSVNNPIVCLADIKTSALAITGIFDVRPFTNTVKEFATVNTTAAGLGYLVAANGTNANQVVTTTTTAATGLRGIVDATTGTTSTTAVNAIITVRGEQYVKVLTGAAVTVAFMIESSATTAGYATSIVGTTALSNYSFGGLVVRANDTTCTATTNCQFSALVDFAPSR